MNNLKVIMKMRSIKAGQLARMTSITEGAIYKLCNNQSQPVYLKDATKLAMALDVPMIKLFPGLEDEIKAEYKLRDEGRSLAKAMI